MGLCKRITEVEFYRASLSQTHVYVTFPWSSVLPEEISQNIIFSVTVPPTIPISAIVDTSDIFIDQVPLSENFLIILWGCEFK